MPEKEAFLEYFIAHQDGLRAFVSALVRDRDARDDVFQEISQTLWKNFDRFDRSRSFGAWARGIARHKIAHQWRQSNRNPVPFSEAALDSVLQAYDETESEETHLREALKRCVESLPARSKRLLEWRYEASMHLKDMARRLASSPGAVNKALFRIRTSLQTCVTRTARILETE